MNREQPVDILLAHASPSIRYRTRKELLDCQCCLPEMLALRKEVEASKPVQDIFNKMHPNGYWTYTNHVTKKTVGSGVEYGAYRTTHYMLSYLMELGLDNNHPLVDKAAQRYMGLQKDDGDWWLHMSCLTGLNIRTFIRLGYRNDQRIQKSIDLMLNTKRWDFGYLCTMHEKKYKKKIVKSCYRGALKMLLAFSELPEYWTHPRVLELVGYFKKRDGIFNSKKERFVNKDIERLTFPITYVSNNWELLLALSKMGYGNRVWLNRAWQYLSCRQNHDGMFPLDGTPGKNPFKPGKKGLPSEWITFYMLLAKKYSDKKT